MRICPRRMLHQAVAVDVFLELALNTIIDDAAPAQVRFRLLPMPDCHGIVDAMPAHRSQDTTPDLFEAAASQPVQAPAPKATIKPPEVAAPSRHMLPKDLPGALKRLEDDEIHTLLAAVSEEAKRRGRLPLEARTAKAPEPVESATRVDKIANARKTARHAPPRSGSSSSGGVLTAARANAVRSAFVAGVKPSAIARQFGISQATVRQVLATETKGR